MWRDSDHGVLITTFEKITVNLSSAQTVVIGKKNVGMELDGWMNKTTYLPHIFRRPGYSLLPGHGREVQSSLLDTK